jgi:uncharacterized protein
MIQREKYISEIRPFYQSDLIKIITGVRRCGKSIILEQIMNEIKIQTSNIIYLDFEDRAITSNIINCQDLIDYIDQTRNQDQLCYVFLDEIQTIDNWAIACKTLRRHNCSLFITGSNSKLLSREFTKELSGRYISFRIRPFVYKELEAYAKELGKSINTTDYLVWGGFPKRIEFDSMEAQKRYLNDLDDTIVLNDIINRYKIRKSEDFKKVVNFILISNARNYSAKSISDYMNSHGTKCSINTVKKWIGYLEEAYIIDTIKQYSTRTKKELEYPTKIYNCDVALNSIRKLNNRYDLTHNLENIVYNELLYMGYDVSVFDNRGKGIDFLAQKENLKYYIQVAYSVAEDKAYDREFNAFNNLSQIDKKIIITTDEIDYSTSNIEHISLKKFIQLTNLK